MGKTKWINLRNPYGVVRKGIPTDYTKADYFRDRKAASAEDWVMENSGEKDLDSKTLKEARDKVKEAFEAVQAITEREVTNPELNDFLNTVRTFEDSNGKPVRTYRTYDGSLAPLPIIRNGSNFKKAGSNTVKVTDRHKNNAQHVNRCVVRTSSPGRLPPARYFTFTDSNILAPDVLRLTHIPYISEENLGDTHFIHSLLTEYTEGIHGTTYGCGEHINDYMMWKLLGILKGSWKRDNRYIYGAIFEMFPNKYSFKQLMTGRALPILCDRFMENSHVSKDCKVGVDNIESLCCHRCLVFGCTNHYRSKDIDPSPLFRVKVRTATETPCGNGCYLSTPNIENVPVPVLDNTSLVQIFKARASRETYHVCELFTQMNIMCSSLHVPSLLCREWFSLLMSFVKQQAIDDNGKEPVTEPDATREIIRERYKVFLNSLKKRDMEKIDNYATLQPCSHPGRSCEDAECPCFARGGVCTKFCRCEVACRIKFPGCACSPGQCRGALCACNIGGWECDPDTCISCNCDLVNPQTGSDKVAKPRCRNVSLQLKNWKKLKADVSLVSGNGCFLVGSAKSGDLIAEYTGEIISQEETERRGVIYDKYGCSYIFQLNHEKSIDACKLGNLIRFANNDSVDPNCLAKTVVVNGEQRIGVYAKRSISDGEELFFNYNYNENHRNEFVALSIHNVKKDKKDAVPSTSSANKN